MPHNEILAVGFDLGHPLCVVLAHYFTDLKLRCATLTLRNRQADHSGGNQAACCSEQTGIVEGQEQKCDEAAPSHRRIERIAPALQRGP